MNIKNREQLLLFIVILSVVAFVGDRLVISPLISLWKDRTVRIHELEQQLNKGTVLLDREDVLRERWQEMKDSVLPDDVSLAESRVLQSLSDCTRQSGVGVDIKPRWIQEEDADYKKMECRVTAQGKAPALARFLYELETLPMALRTEEIEFLARDATGQNLTLTLRFTGLVFTGEML